MKEEGNICTRGGGRGGRGICTEWGGGGELTEVHHGPDKLGAAPSFGPITTVFCAYVLDAVACMLMGEEQE
jgi:hypothetical protein